MTKTANFAGLFSLAVGALLGSSSLAQQIQLVERPPDPHGSPRPARDARDVPIKTSIYLELGTPAHANSGEVSPESVSVRLQEQGGEVVAILQLGCQFAKGAAGWLRPKQDLQGAKSLPVYIESGRPLQPATKYTIVVSAGAVNQKDAPVTAGTWSFSTESVPAVHTQEFSLDLKSEPIHWQGRFFSGICNVIFCTQAANYGPTFDDAGPLPQREDPDAPGLFPPGGCYLRKFNPHGTACYYWGRLDKEWDLACRRYGRRVVANFADAPGDLARDGRSWTTVKDYPQWHEVARAIAGHIIDRYGADALNFTWSVFNEPDLGPMFWRADWNELQKFYDYTTDAILRAFEDRGFRSGQGLHRRMELGGIFGTRLKLKEFLAHCSPRAQAEGAAPKNAAFADQKLDGKRSKRVESLCQKHAGKGTPCDFISIHSYNRSDLMAAKLIRAKEVALEIDAQYYRALSVNSHGACPDWMPPPDLAAADAYLGNGYFETWCTDVVHRQLLQAGRDPRFAFGETILTVWPPPSNFAGINAVTRVIHVDDNGDSIGDRTVTVPMPIFHVLGLLSELGDR
jgi:Glycosyl hydrolases family 39